LSHSKHWYTQLAIQDLCGATSPIKKWREQGSKILLEVKERIPDRDRRTEKKKILQKHSRAHYK
jgi:hypothetical protein